MESRYSRMKKNDWKMDVIWITLLMGFAFFINRDIEIKGLYMDDLYLWSCFGEQSFFEYAFPVGSTRFRFIYNIAAWLELFFTGSHVEWMVPINIILNGMIAATVYWFGKKLSKIDTVGFLAGIMYLLSRMSYYQISQVYGLMETMALWMAIVILYLLYLCLNLKEREWKYFIAASWLYFAICFVHERYMALLPLFVLVLLFKKEKSLKRWLAPLWKFAAVQAIRAAVIGSVLPAGTGGTQVADTFSIAGAMKFAVSQVLYVFGINAGPEHLNGLSWADSPAWIRIFVLAADAVLLVLVLVCLVKILRQKEKRLPLLQNSLLFLVFIAMCIGCSSVTIRVEMRWVYVSLTAALLYLAYLCGAARNEEKQQENEDGKRPMAGLLAEQIKRRRYIKSVAFYICMMAVYVALMFPVESFYRDKFVNIYLWPNQLRYNSLAEETYGKYGDEIFGKTIYIVGNSYEMSEFTAETFFKVFDKERKAEGTKVAFVDSVKDIGQVDDYMLVLREDPAHNAFQDITDFVRSEKCEINYGYYRDGWMDEEASLRILTGKTGTIDMELMYPGPITGKETVTIFADGKKVKKITLSQNITDVTLEQKPYSYVNLEFSNNFIMPDALEQRGEKKFSLIVNFKTE